MEPVRKVQLATHFKTVKSLLKIILSNNIGSKSGSDQPEPSKIISKSMLTRRSWSRGENLDGSWW